MTRGRGVRIALTALLIGVAVAFLLPQVWLFALSLKTKAGVYEYPPRLWSNDASGANYAFVLTRTQLPWYLWNSLVVSIASTVATMAIGAPAAYVLSRERVRRRETVATGLLLAQMVSPIVLLVPLYGLVAHLHLLDSHTGLVLVYVAVQLPFTIVVLRNFFDALPKSLFEAALLDGATRATTFRKIALPLLGPGLASVAIFNLASYWAEFGLALVLLDSQQRYTIPIGLFSFQSGYETEWQLVAAASFIGLLPVLAAFLALQRFFVAGLTSGATKG
ncbi:MAG TPA: carbohydrate ABC transporter permease [Vicinamibacterales bacterium]|nr:carbohydrate ABC transporter permease [Vicinamibacterales bacterium]